MASSEEGNSAVGRSIVEEIMNASHLAAQLEGFLKEIMVPGNNCLTARAILEDLNGSIARALLLLEGQEGLEAVAGSPGSCGDMRTGEFSSGKIRKYFVQAANLEQRGGIRRRLQPSSSKTIVSKTLEDGKTWRKYGQKHIHSSKHPRSYFRCTHKHDQGCKALKQVQCLEEDPTKLMITYIGEHTCVDPSMLPHIFISNSGFQDSCLISFGQEESPLFFSSSSQLKKELDIDEALSSNTSGSSSSSDHAHSVAAEAEIPPPPAPVSAAAATMSDHGDASSQSPAYINLEFHEFMTDHSLGFYDQNVFWDDYDFF